MAFDLLIELDEDLLAFEKRLEFEFLVGVGEDVMERLHLGQLRIFGLVAVALQFGDHLVQKGQISLHVRPLSIVLVHHDYFEATPDQRLQWEGALGAPRSRRWFAVHGRSAAQTKDFMRAAIPA